MAKRYYAVRNGRTVGIFTDFKRVQKSIYKYSGADFAGFLTKIEAYEYLGDIEPDIIESLPEENNRGLDDPSVCIAYTDGSFIREIDEHSYGSGVVLLHSDNTTEVHSLRGNEAIELGNVSAEIVAAKTAMSIAKNKGYKKLILNIDYIGVANWVDESSHWQPKKPFTKAYKRFYEQEIKPYLEVEFRYVKSHSKQLWNDLADCMSKRALTH
jgi:ribonuclease HI